MDTIAGALLIGTWVNSALYAVEIIQAAYYYRHFKNDSLTLKLVVSAACFIDGVSMIGNYACVYLYTIIHWGDIAYLANQYWPVPLYAFTTGIVATIVQIFLVTRYWKLTKNFFITPILLLFIMVALGGAFATSVIVAIHPTYKERAKLEVPVTIWLSSEAATDVSIALALLWEFRKVKSSFQETRSRVNRLVSQTIQTGAVGATIALAVLITYLTNNQSNVPVGIAYCIDRIYILTMLANLNIRKQRDGTTRLSMLDASAGATRGQSGRSEIVNDYGGIHVHRTATVHIDRLPGSASPMAGSFIIINKNESSQRINEDGSDRIAVNYSGLYE
ncbi:hypothetical protein C8R43DRAFT_98523 [Mycena crocata]|nr:hypothetical protein C8R43DRAFT_98523 [Mycena crocata]